LDKVSLQDQKWIYLFVILLEIWKSIFFFVHRISIFNHKHGRSRGCSTWRDVRWSRHKHRLSLICNRSTNDCSGFCTPSKTTALNRTVPALTDH